MMAPAKKNRPAKSPPELKLYVLRNPDYYAKACAAGSEAEACKILGGPVDWIDDPKLLRKMKRRPGVKFQKLAGMKKDWEVWE
jgi:hypothetical protein